MILQRASLAGLAVGCALALGPTLHAQDSQTMTRDRTTTTTTETHQSYGDSNWRAPEGYDQAYPENGTPNMVARQGYAAGFNEGQADAARGKKFEPTDNKAYDKAVIPKGMSHEQFKQDFHEAFVKGYTNGYRGERH